MNKSLFIIIGRCVVLELARAPLFTARFYVLRSNARPFFIILCFSLPRKKQPPHTALEEPIRRTHSGLLLRALVLASHVAEADAAVVAAVVPVFVLVVGTAVVQAA